MSCVFSLSGRIAMSADPEFDIFSATAPFARRRALRTLRQHFSSPTTRQVANVERAGRL